MGTGPVAIFCLSEEAGVKFTEPESLPGTFKVLGLVCPPFCKPGGTGPLDRPKALFRWAVDFLALLESPC